MKYCTKCGASMEDDASFCPHCGAKVDGGQTIEPEPAQVNTKIKKRDSTVMTVALILCIINTVLCGFALIPLIWMVPLTVALNKKINNKEPMSVAFKVVILIFVELIAGILLLVGDDSDE